jgi:glyoxylase-like metal-dependent hydrolase (beta-lactamase superfamily II)
MRISRRDFIGGAAGLAAAPTLGLLPHAVHAQLAIGDIRLDVVSDGYLTLPGGFIFDPMPKDELAPILARLGQSADVLTPPCNVTLMRRGDRTILFDAGSGPDFSPGSGVLLDSLDALGVTPDTVTDVIFTHAHPDHLWGILDDFGDPVFARADYRIGRQEWDYWMDPDTVDRIGEARASFAVGARRRLEMIADRITFFEGGDEILTGVAARATLGHTPGHMAFEVRDGTDAVMILGDCIGNDHIAFARPGWPSGSDQDPETAAATRLSLMDQLSHEKTRVIGFHLTGNGIGHIEKTTDGYAFVAEGS